MVACRGRHRTRIHALPRNASSRAPSTAPPRTRRCLAFPAKTGRAIAHPSGAKGAPAPTPRPRKWRITVDALFRRRL